MATSVASVVSHFPEAENGFTTTTAGSVSSGAVTVTLNSVAGYTNGEPVVLVIDPTDAAKKQTFTGIVDTGGVQVTSVVWTAGTNQTHALGATVVDYATATHISMISKGIKVEHSQDGTHKAALITSRTADTAPLGADSILTYDLSATALKKVTLSDLFKTPPVTESTMSATDWKEGVLPAQSGTIVNNGNRSYDIPFASTVANILSPGMRLRTTRTVTAPTQCTDLESGSSQYYSKSTPNKLTFTDDFVVSAWIKLESYTASSGMIASRYNGTSGWALYVVGSTGQIKLEGFNGGSSNVSTVASYQSIPLGKWVHVAAQLDMSAFTATTTTSYVMIDGLDVPAAVSRGGTNPTALVQAGNLEIGSWNSGVNPFDGKLAQVAIYNAKVTQATIKASMNQTLSGSETSLASAYSFNNSIADLNTTTPNDLTAQASAVATNADSPFGVDSNGVPGIYDYAVVMKVSTTTATVQVPEGCTIPTSGGVSAVAYSTTTSPFGFTLDKGRWEVGWFGRTAMTKATPTAATYYSGGTANGEWAFSLPVGAWDFGYSINGQCVNATAVPAPQITLSTSNSAQTDADFTMRMVSAVTGASSLDGLFARRKFTAVSSATTYYPLIQCVTASATSISLSGANGTSIITAIPAGV